MHHHMITVGGYFPASGKNTIRKSSNKYSLLKAGDSVTMCYCAEVDSDGEPVNIIATESLIVTSVVRSSLGRLVDHHVKENHAAPYSRTGLDVINLLEGVYGKLSLEDAFMAVYFA